MDKYRFEYIKQQVDGLEYMSRTIHFKKTGSLYKGLCPFHNEKTASFTVYPKGFKNKKQQPQQYATFYCFGCGVAGDVINFKKLKDNLDTNEEACYELEKEFGINVNDVDIQMEYIKQQIQQMKNHPGNFLRLDEINLACSSQCRNYLNIVKEYYPDEFDNENNIIEEFYIYLDNELNERSEITAMELVNETTNMISERLNILKNKKTII